MPITPDTTSQEFTQLLKSALNGIAPASPPPVPVTAVLARHRRTLQALRAKGYTPDQLAAVLKHPSIGLSISPVTLNRLLKRGPRTGPTRLKVEG